MRSERQCCERRQDDLLFKWFLDLNSTDAACDASTFSKNRDRLLRHDVAAQFFDALLAAAHRPGLLADAHFTVDGTLLESWASLKSFRPTGGPTDSDGSAPPPAGGRTAAVDFHGQKRSNASHASTTDPDARLARTGKGKEAKLCLAGHVLMENRTGLAVDVRLTHATGTAARAAALRMLDRRPAPLPRGTLGADKGSDTRAFVTQCRARQVTPPVTQNTKGRRRAIDGRTTRHPGSAISQRIRNRVEAIFGWTKTVGGGRKLRYRGLARNQCWAELTTAASNLVRLINLIPSAV